MSEENFITDPLEIQLTEQDQVQTILGKPSCKTKFLTKFQTEFQGKT